MAWISNVITVIGTLGGVFLGQYYGGKSQREQWLRDNKKEECRELLTALSSASIALAYWYGAIDDIRGQITVLGNIEIRKQEYVKANTLLQMILIDRLFISKEVRGSQHKRGLERDR